MQISKINVIIAKSIRLNITSLVDKFPSLLLFSELKIIIK